VESLGNISFGDTVQISADYEPRLSTKISLAGESVTVFHVLDGKGGAKSFEGKEITPLLDENRSFKGAEVCCAVTLQRPWVHSEAGVVKAGNLWRVEEAILKAAPKRKWASIFNPSLAQ
jgi:hypothetical protein